MSYHRPRHKDIDIYIAPLTSSKIKQQFIAMLKTKVPKVGKDFAWTARSVVWELVPFITR